MGTAGTFAVTSTGSPTATLTETGALPGGVTFTDNGNGTATLAGTPAAGTQRQLPDHDHRGQRGRPNATQAFTLTVNPATVAPVITSADGDDVRRGQRRGRSR